VFGVVVFGFILVFIVIELVVVFDCIECIYVCLVVMGY